MGKKGERPYPKQKMSLRSNDTWAKKVKDRTQNKKCL